MQGKSTRSQCMSDTSKHSHNQSHVKHEMQRIAQHQSNKIKALVIVKVLSLLHPDSWKYIFFYHFTFGHDYILIKA